MIEQLSLNITHLKVTTMNKIELLANDIGMLSNKSIQELVAVLVREYPGRADQIDMSLRTEFINLENDKLRK